LYDSAAIVYSLGETSAASARRIDGSVQVMPMSAPCQQPAPTPLITVVVPLFNEQENVEALYRRLDLVLRSLDLPYEILLVDDGSHDLTPQLIDALTRKDPRVTAIQLSRNFGHQAAISAGIDHARGQAVIVMDGDLQDPPELLPQLIAKWREGYEVVYAVRQERKEGPLKRLGYFSFYRIFRAISDLDIPLDSGDFCLMDRCVVDVLKHLPERMRFMRGLRSFVGFRQIGLAYERGLREAGKPKYRLGALVYLAIDGLISFSSYPLRLVSYLGLFTISIALVLLVWVVSSALYAHKVPQGWASTIVTVLFMGSIQLFSLGIIGEYIRLIFLETKRRPTYITRDTQGSQDRRHDAPDQGTCEDGSEGAGRP
jgi:polyisoprenyl-phosphate glycosyltransferase